MANLILIVGDTSTGKSTSMETLNPEETVIINCGFKPLPFADSGEKYKVGVNLFNVDTSAAVVKILQQVNGPTPAGRLPVKNVVIDDSNFIMSEVYFRRSEETGYGKFTSIAKDYQAVLSQCKSMRNDLNIAVMMHEEDLVSNGIIVGKKGKTVGKLVDDQYNPLSVVTVCLFTSVSFGKDGVPVYQFITNRCQKAGVVIPAKSPKGMFPELGIPNDLNVAFQAARNFYKL